MTQLSLGLEKQRRATNKSKLEAILRDGEWHTNAELVEACGWRYGGRLFELSKAVLRYEKEDLGGGLFRFRAVSWGAA